MGYRNYLGSISKKEYDKVKNFNKKQLFDYLNGDIEEDYVCRFNILTNKSIFELGKYINLFDKKFFKPFFLNKNVQDYYTQEQEEFFIVRKEFLKEVIKRNEQSIIDNYKSLLKPFIDKSQQKNDFMKLVKIDEVFEPANLSVEEQVALYNIIKYAKNNLFEWTQLEPYNLEEGNKVTTSWKYEYAIFELVRIYKTFDWEKEIMVYYGY